MERLQTQSEGAIWDRGSKLFVKIGEETYDVLKAEKKGEKYPDWKCEKVAIWDRISSKGNEYRFIKYGDEDYVAFKSRKKANEKSPDWVIKKSQPMPNKD